MQEAASYIYLFIILCDNKQKSSKKKKSSILNYKNAAILGILYKYTQ